WLKAKKFAPSAEFERLNLVAATSRLCALEQDDPSVLRLYEALAARTHISKERLARTSSRLRDVHLWGSLLRLSVSGSKAVDRNPLDALQDTLGELGAFLDANAGLSDLVIRLDGEQLSAGMRLLQLLRDGQYDVVVANPPYLGIQKTVGFEILR